jgi:hypothetical protein
MFQCLAACLDDLVDTHHTNDKDEIIVLKDSWEFDGTQCAAGFARQFKSVEDLKVPGNFGCA